MIAKKTIPHDWDSLDFSYRDTEAMYVQVYDQEWQDPDIVVPEDFSLHPAASALNYGQGIFEGLKAKRTTTGHVTLFRPEQNAERFQNGARRMCMPSVHTEQFTQAVKQVVQKNIKHVPPTEKGSLYVRALLIGSGAKLGIGPSQSYTFIVFVCPVGPYFKDGVTPISLKVPENIHRTAPGGTGGIKAIGNYGPGMLHVLEAKKEGFDELLYLEARQNKYVEECGAANFFAMIDGVLYTAPLNDTILPGITRDSIIHIAKALGIIVAAAPLKITDVLRAQECFCTGTAAGVAPVGRISYKNKDVMYNDGTVGEITQRLRNALEDIQCGVDHPILRQFSQWRMNIPL
ncbi:MAG: branched chain amino acid aminotransferase [Candidatus Magasanikbacteria bacterium]|nr:branched chain amino acid aminotransferase [Candidatus Magasanikbacteria bacterium]